MIVITQSIQINYGCNKFETLILKTELATLMPIYK